MYGTDNNDTINSGGLNNSIFGYAGDDLVKLEYASNISVSGGDGNDSIQNGGYYVNGGTMVAIDAGAGNDFIRNQNSNVTIDAGDGDDYIRNHGYDDDPYAASIHAASIVAIDLGAGNDSIINWGDKVSIKGGEGNDSIENYGYNVLIDGGAGNDLISLSSDASLTFIKYAAGDGSDTIIGFDSDDTLKIGGGNYSTQVSGDDVVITVGDGSITLVDAANLEFLNIADDRPSWSLEGTTATYGDWFAVGSVKSLDGLSLNGYTGYGRRGGSQQSRRVC